MLGAVQYTFVALVRVSPVVTDMESRLHTSNGKSGDRDRDSCHWPGVGLGQKARHLSSIPLATGYWSASVLCVTRGR